MIRGIGLMLVVVMVHAARGAAVEGAYAGADAELLADVRTGFETAPESAAETRRLIERLDGTLPAETARWPAVFRAYRAALEGLAGKHSSRPWMKYRHAKEAIARWPGIVEGHPDSIELRLLRYTFASQLPEFFGLRDQARDDLAVLTDLMERQSDPMVTPEYVRDAVRWILQHGEPEEGIRGRLEAWGAAGRRTR